MLKNETRNEFLVVSLAVSDGGKCQNARRGRQNKKRKKKERELAAHSSTRTTRERESWHRARNFETLQTLYLFIYFSHITRV